MLFQLAVPVTVLVAHARRLLQTHAPSNVVIARVRASRPTMHATVFLASAAIVLAAVAHRLTLAIERGSPAWLNLVVLVLLWDAIKFAIESAVIVIRGIVALCRTDVSSHLATWRPGRLPSPSGVQPLAWNLVSPAPDRQDYTS